MSASVKLSNFFHELPSDPELIFEIQNLNDAPLVTYNQFPNAVHSYYDPGRVFFLGVRGSSDALTLFPPLLSRDGRSGTILPELAGGMLIMPPFLFAVRRFCPRRCFEDLTDVCEANLRTAKHQCGALPV